MDVLAAMNEDKLWQHGIILCEAGNGIFAKLFTGECFCEENGKVLLINPYTREVIDEWGSMEEWLNYLDE